MLQNRLTTNIEHKGKKVTRNKIILKEKNAKVSTKKQPLLPEETTK
jgi:hypothetical protein